MTKTVRSVAWLKDDPPGSEFARIEIAGDVLHATGVAIASEPAAYRLDYTLETRERFVTNRIQLRAEGEGWHRTLDLRRSASGAWTATGEADGLPDLGEPGITESVDGALDCDLGLSPVTNSMPVLRHGQLEGGSHEFTVAWISVPDLRVHAERQRNTFVSVDGDARVVRFESLDGTFTADIRFDADGLVVDYPGIARRIG